MPEINAKLGIMRQDGTWVLEKDESTNISITNKLYDDIYGKAYIGLCKYKKSPTESNMKVPFSYITYLKEFLAVTMLSIEDK